MKNKKITRRLFLAVSAAASGMYLVGRRFFGPPLESSQWSSTDNDPIVSAAIYPAIGVARVGNSLEKGNDFFDGPEVDTQLYLKNIKARDKRGALKRQAQRFRIYAKTQSGKTVELTADNAIIHWSVHLANKKANWYRFDVAMDIEEARQHQLRFPLRNADVRDRKSLEIEPKTKTISGRNLSGEIHKFETKNFMGLPVQLGELRTDQKGRLRVLGGLGKAGTPDPKKYPIYNEAVGQTFNNADGWYDDTSDGSVHARVTVDGEDIPVTGAWVIVTPPN
ncbi:MAG: LodA/GoxA family CTQ-dependent oxidase, partial [Pseudobdellovibrionaceae bacterium]